MQSFSEWPGLYSLVLSLALGYALVYYETSLGAKIEQWSSTQISLVLFVICIVAKNVFVPSRANRFIVENTNHTANSQSGSNQSNSKGAKNVKSKQSK